MDRILVIEDDEKLNEGICLALKDNMKKFISCKNIAEGRKELNRNEFELVLLDINLPDGNGMDFLKEFRKEHPSTPVIIITANNMEMDIVTGLELGANDYITKPFSLMVLRARVNVQLRNRSKTNSEIYNIDNLHLDFNKMIFEKEGVNIELSKTEQRLLRMFVENKGRTLTRNQLIDYVWSGESEFVEQHALTVTIKRLRDKLEADSAESKYIKTVYGIGYVWIGGE